MQHHQLSVAQRGGGGGGRQRGGVRGVAAQDRVPRNAANYSRIKYTTGAGGAVATFVNTGGLQINGQTLSCLGVPSVGTPTFTCNITVSPTNLDANLGATSGCLFTEGGGAFCNYGP